MTTRTAGLFVCPRSSGEKKLNTALRNLRQKGKTLPDVQKDVSPTNIPLNRVGIKEYRNVFRIEWGGVPKEIEICMDAYVNLPKTNRAAHISRFTENAYNAMYSKHVYTPYSLCIALSRGLLAKFEKSTESEVYLNMKLPLEGITPNGFNSREFIGISIYCRSKKIHDKIMINKSKIEIRRIGVLGCPCVKRMIEAEVTAQGFSEEVLPNLGTHSEKGIGSIQLIKKGMIKEPVDIIGLTNLIERNFSSVIRDSLKRPDELMVVKSILASPKFAEDIVRGIANNLKNMFGVTDFEYFIVNVESSSSLHDYLVSATYEGHF